MLPQCEEKVEVNIPFGLLQLLMHTDVKIAI